MGGKTAGGGGEAAGGRPGAGGGETRESGARSCQNPELEPQERRTLSPPRGAVVTAVQPPAERDRDRETGREGPTFLLLCHPLSTPDQNPESWGACSLQTMEVNVPDPKQCGRGSSTVLPRNPNWTAGLDWEEKTSVHPPESVWQRENCVSVSQTHPSFNPEKMRCQAREG